MSSNIISVENDDSFHKLDVKNIIVEKPNQKPTPNQKGVWANIKYKYEGKLDKLKIQTTQLFSYGISRYEETSPSKMSFVMRDRKLREMQANGEQLSDEQLLDIELEDGTIKILEDIMSKVREELMTSEMIAALNKTRDKKWASNVESMEIVKRKEQDNGIDSVYMYAKVVEGNNFMKTKFYDNDDQPLDLADTVVRLLDKNITCRVIAMIVVDSVFIGAKEPYIQLKLSEAILSSVIESKPKRDIRLSSHLKNKLVSEKPIACDSDSDSDSPSVTCSNKNVINNDSDSDN